MATINPNVSGAPSSTDVVISTNRAGGWKKYAYTPPGAGTFTARADVPALGADGNQLATIVGYRVRYDTVSMAPFGGYASSQYFAGGDPVAGLVVTGLATGTTYYYTVEADDGTNAGMPSFEASATT